MKTIIAPLALWVTAITALPHGRAQIEQNHSSTPCDSTAEGSMTPWGHSTTGVPALPAYPTWTFDTSFAATTQAIPTPPTGAYYHYPPVRQAGGMPFVPLQEGGIEFSATSAVLRREEAVETRSDHIFTVTRPLRTHPVEPTVTTDARLFPTHKPPQLRLPSDSASVDARQLRLPTATPQHEARQLRLPSDTPSAVLDSRQLRLPSESPSYEVRQLRLPTDAPSATLGERQLRLPTDEPSATLDARRLLLPSESPSVDARQLRLPTDSPAATLVERQLRLPTDEPSATVAGRQLRLPSESPSHEARQLRLPTDAPSVDARQLRLPTGSHSTPVHIRQLRLPTELPTVTITTRQLRLPTDASSHEARQLRLPSDTPSVEFRKFWPPTKTASSGISRPTLPPSPPTSTADMMEERRLRLLGDTPSVGARQLRLPSELPSLEGRQWTRPTEPPYNRTTAFAGREFLVPTAAVSSYGSSTFLMLTSPCPFQTAAAFAGDENWHIGGVPAAVSAASRPPPYELTCHGKGMLKQCKKAKTICTASGVIISDAKHCVQHCKCA